MFCSSSIIKEYLDNNKDVFNDYEIDYILWFLNKKRVDRDIPYFVLELCDELGCLPDEYNIYTELFDEIVKHNIENKKIVEIGGGILPRFAKRVSYKLNNGQIMVYDPRLSSNISSNDKLVLKNKSFNFLENINSDLLVSIKPFGIEEEILSYIDKNKIDYFIVPSEIDYSNKKYDYYNSSDEWIMYLINRLRYITSNNDLGKMKVKKLRTYQYPLIYNEK